MTSELIYSCGKTTKNKSCQVWSCLTQSVNSNVFTKVQMQKINRGFQASNHWAEAEVNQNITINIWSEKPTEWSPCLPHQLQHVATEQKTGWFWTKLSKEVIDYNHLNAGIGFKSCVSPVSMVPHDGRIESLFGKRQGLNLVAESSIKCNSCQV